MQGVWACVCVSRISQRWRRPGSASSDATWRRRLGEASGLQHAASHTTTAPPGAFRSKSAEGGASNPCAPGMDGGNAANVVRRVPAAAVWALLRHVQCSPVRFRLFRIHPSPQRP